MKRPLLVIVSAIVFLAILIVGSTWVLGALTESGFRDFVASVEKNPSAQQVDLELPEYERGFLKSSGTTSVSVVGVEHEAFLKHEIYHGPFAMTPDGFKAGYSYIITTLDREKFPEDIKTSLGEVYGDTEPFTIKTIAPLVGDHISEVEVAPVNHDAGTLTVRFDGAECRFEVSPDQESMDGSMRIGELALNESSEDSGFSLNVAESNLKVAVEERDSVKAGGSFGAVSFKTQGGEGPEVSVKAEPIEVQSDYEALKEKSPVMLGGAKAVAPKILVAVGQTGEVEVSNFSVSTEATEAEDLIQSSVTYEVESIRETFSESDEWASYLGLLENGAMVRLATRFPESSMETFVEIQRDMQLAQRKMMENAEEGKGAAADQAEAMMQSYGKMIKAITKGSGISLDVVAGEGEDGMNLDFDFTYTGEEPMTSQKTILELVQKISVELGFSIPKSLVPETEQTRQQLAMLTASGSLKETPASYQTEMVLEDGKLTTNGQPNLLFEQMAPMMVQPIPWDSMFSGPQPAADAPDPADDPDPAEGE